MTGLHDLRTDLSAEAPSCPGCLAVAAAGGTRPAWRCPGGRSLVPVLGRVGRHRRASAVPLPLDVQLDGEYLVPDRGCGRPHLLGLPDDVSGRRSVVGHAPTQLRQPAVDLVAHPPACDPPR